MFNEVTFKNLIITEHWPSNNLLFRGSSFSTSSNSLCNEYRTNFNSLLNIRNYSSQTSITGSVDGLSASNNSISSSSIPSCYSSHISIFSSQKSLLDTIEEEKWLWKKFFFFFKKVFKTLKKKKKKFFFFKKKFKKIKKKKKKNLKKKKELKYS